MTIRNFQSKAAPAVLPNTPISPDANKIEEEPNSKGLPSGEEWVAPDLFASTTAADEPLPNDGISNETVDQGKLDDFLLSFFTLFKAPTDRQIHLLAEAVGMSYDELERAVYRLTSALTEDEEEEEGEDEIEVQDL